MSISSCPQCGKHVTIPAGIDTSVRVRCPLCQAQYALADALSNMPPLLEVVDEPAAESMTAAPLSDGPPAEWFDEPAAPAEAAPPEPAAGEPDLALPVDLADAPNEPFGLDLEDGPPQEIEHDDFVMQEKDTEVEEIGFSLADPLVRDVPTNIDHIDPAEPNEESVFDLGDSTPSHDTSAEQPPAQHVPADEEISLDFDEFMPAEEPVAAEASQPGEELVGGEEFVAEEIADEENPAGEEFSSAEFSLDEPTAGDDAATESELFGDDSETVDFVASGQSEAVLIPSAAPDEEMELDFGEEAAADPAPVVEETPAAEGKKDKKKKKKQREPKAPKEGRRRPLATVVSLLLSTLIALPLTLYGLLWLSPEYDFFNIGRTLAAWYVPVPAKFSKPQASRMVAAVPQNTAPQAPSGPQATTPQTLPTEPEPAESATPVPAQPPAANETPSAPGLSDAEPKPDAKPSDPAPATDPPADDAAFKDSPADPITAPILPAAAAEAEEMPEEPSLPEPEKPALEDPATEKPSLEEPASDKPASDAKPQPVTAAKPTAKDDEADLFAPAEPDAKPVKRAEPEPEAESEPLGPVNAARFTLTDLAHAMQEAAAANAKMLAAQGDKNDAEFKKVRSNFYLGLFHLAEVLTLVQDDGLGGKLDAQRKQFAEVVLQFAADPKRLDALKFNAGRWLGFGKRTTPGLVLAGTVESAEQVGKLYHVKLAIGPGSSAPIVTVVGTKDPALAPGDQSLVLGVIVDNPSEQLSGYEGDDATVIWSGVTLKLPADK